MDPTPVALVILMTHSLHKAIWPKDIKNGKTQLPKKLIILLPVSWRSVQITKPTLHLPRRN